MSADCLPGEALNSAHAHCTVDRELGYTFKQLEHCTVYTAYNAVVGTLWKSRYNPDRSVRGPGGGGHHAAAVGVSEVVMVLVLNNSKR